MYHHLTMDYLTMQAQFETEKNRKAFVYTVVICVVLLLLALLIRWTIDLPPTPIIPDLIEVNLGNSSEGWGQEQPLIKGDMSEKATPVQQREVKATVTHDEPAKDIQPDENENDKEAAPVIKPKNPDPKSYTLAKKEDSKPAKNATSKPVVMPVPRPQTPIAAYKGPGNGKGNGATEDNGYRNQGNNPNGRGDAGSPNGNPDSYGTADKGRVGGPKVIRGDRNIIRYYSFTDDLDRATINAIIKVSADGKGTFTGFDRGSSTTSSAYATAIQQHLSQIQFSKSDHESVVTVQFNFNVK